MVLSVYEGNSSDNYTLKDSLVKRCKQKVSVLHNKGQKQQGPKRAEGIKKRCQEYTEELYNKSLNDLITTMVWSLT